MKRLLIAFSLLLLTGLSSPSYCSPETSNLLLSVAKENNKVFISWRNFKLLAFAETQKPKALFWELSNGKQTKSGTLPPIANGTLKATLAPNNYSFEIRTCIIETEIRPIALVLGPIQAHLNFTVEASEFFTTVLNISSKRNSIH